MHPISDSDGVEIKGYIWTVNPVNDVDATIDMLIATIEDGQQSMWYERKIADNREALMKEIRSFDNEDTLLA